MKSTATPTRSKTSDTKKNGSRHSTAEPELPDSVADPASKSAPSEKVKDGVRQMTEDAKSKINESAQSIADAAREKIDLTKAKVSDLAETSKRTAEEKYEQYAATVREKPMGAVGVAAAVGLVVGAVLGSMLSRRS